MTDQDPFALQPGETDMSDQAVQQQPEPQTEVITPTKRTLVIAFSRTMQPKQYESATASAEMTVELPDGATVEEGIAVYHREMRFVKASVLEQLGLGFVEDPATKMIMETFAGSEVVASSPAPQQQAPAQQAAPQGNAFAGTGFNAPAATPPQQQGNAFAAPAPAIKRNFTPKPEDDPIWDGIVAELNAGPAQTFYDNRVGKTNPKGPDFKQKTKDGWAVWLNACPDRYMDYFGLVAG